MTVPFVPILRVNHGIKLPKILCRSSWSRCIAYWEMKDLSETSALKYLPSKLVGSGTDRTNVRDLPTLDKYFLFAAACPLSPSFDRAMALHRENACDHVLRYKITRATKNRVATVLKLACKRVRQQCSRLVRDAVLEDRVSLSHPDVCLSHISSMPPGCPYPGRRLYRVRQRYRPEALRQYPRLNGELGLVA